MRHYLDKKGNEMPESVEHRAQRMTSWDLLYHLLRWRVEGMQSQYVKGLTEDQRPKGTYENGCTITNIEDVGNGGVRVTYTHKDRGEGQTAVADMVLAADGGSSTIKHLLNPTITRDYAGYVRKVMGRTSSEPPGWHTMSQKERQLLRSFAKTSLASTLSFFMRRRLPACLTVEAFADPFTLLFVGCMAWNSTRAPALRRCQRFIC